MCYEFLKSHCNTGESRGRKAGIWKGQAWVKLRLPQCRLMFSDKCRGTKSPESGEIEVMAPNTGAGQDFKGADEQKGAQAKGLHWVQLSHFAPYLGMSGLPCNIGQHQKTTSWSGLELTGKIHLCRQVGPPPISGHIYWSALPLVPFPWKQWVLLDLTLMS